MNKAELIEKQQAKIAALKKSVMNVRSPQSKITLKLLKLNVKSLPKQLVDKKGIIELVSIVDDDHTLKIISNKFDTPNIIAAIESIYDIEECYISTWAVTPIGISRLQSLSEKNVKCTVLLDRTHSYKWTFESGAYKILKNVNFVFSENHSKFVLFKLKDGSVINFIGSFNLSNNPRYENIEINRIKDEYEFYKSFIIGVQNGTYESQKTLF